MDNASNKPDYKRIFFDILYKKYPHKIQKCMKILSKKSLSATDIIMLNDIIFETQSRLSENSHKFRSYDKTTILRILDYQKKNKLNNTQLASHYKLSRNTITKWKKFFLS